LKFKLEFWLPKLYKYPPPLPLEEDDLLEGFYKFVSLEVLLPLFFSLSFFFFSHLGARLPKNTILG
jgi:hypothetical protein